MRVKEGRAHKERAPSRKSPQKDSGAADRSVGCAQNDRPSTGGGGKGWPVAWINRGPFVCSFRNPALQERPENCRAVLDPKKRMLQQKLDRSSNPAETIARRKLHASVSRASQAGENKAPAELALARFVLFPRNLLTVRRGKKGSEIGGAPDGTHSICTYRSCGFGSLVCKLSGLSILSERWLSFFLSRPPCRSIAR